MAYCGPRGIPYTAFLGAPGGGWDELSRDAALAWHADEMTRCQGCGQDRGDWYERDEAGEVVRDAAGYPVVAVPPRFRVESTYCPGCQLLDGHRRSIQDNQSAYMHPHFVPVHPATRPSDGVRSAP